MELKKATNLAEAYRVFETQVPLKPAQREFYVELYGRDIQNLRKELVLNRIPNKTIFLTGQSGNGKSTALNFLPDNRLETLYDIKYINGRDVFKLDDVDIIDLILMIGFTVVQGHPVLERRFLGELEEMRKLKLGRIEKECASEDVKKEQAGARVGIGAKLPLLHLIRFDTSLFARYKIEREKRNAIRELFVLDKLELIEKINQILSAYLEHIGGDKQLLLIVDDLEKVRGHDQTLRLFIENSDVFQKIECTKVVTFPVFLATRHAMYQDAFKFGVRITPNPFSKAADENGVVKDNLHKLEQVVFNRLENKTLVRQDAVHTAIDQCGGNIRFLLEIMQKAARNAIRLEDDKESSIPVLPIDVESAVEEISSLPSLAVMKRIRVLKTVMKTHREPEDLQYRDDFVDSILDNTVMAYFNGHPWYDLNPMIVASVKAYAKRTG